MISASPPSIFDSEPISAGNLDFRGVRETRTSKPRFPKTKFKHPDFFFAGVCVAAWGLGFMRYLGVGYVYFPDFPNLLDVIGLVSVGAFLVWKSLK